MALFKIKRGKKDTFNITNVPFTDGYAYLTSDDGKFYIDAHTAEGYQVRWCINPGMKVSNNSLILEDSYVYRSSEHVPEIDE